jgi:hypothetical protein
VSGEQHGTRSDAGGVGGHGFYFISALRHADTRSAPNINRAANNRKKTLTGPDTAGVRPKARDASRRARVQASRGVLV